MTHEHKLSNKQTLSEGLRIGIVATLWNMKKVATNNNTLIRGQIYFIQAYKNSNIIQHLAMGMVDQINIHTNEYDMGSKHCKSNNYSRVTLQPSNTACIEIEQSDT